MAQTPLLRRATAPFCALAFALAISCPIHAESIKILYNFSASEQGEAPQEGLAEGPDGRLYGSTLRGGPLNDGTLFSVRPGGTDFRTVFIFDEIESVSAPDHILIGADGRIYGSSRVGPPSNRQSGAVFSVKRNGTDFKIVRTFSPDEGEDPARLIEIDGRLYGTTRRGGADPAQGVSEGSGTVYSMRRDGSDFRLLKVFASEQDGSDPASGVTLAADGRLYGTTIAGGLNDGGTLYSLNRDGTGFIVHQHLDETSPANRVRGRVLAGSDGYLYVVLNPFLVRFLPGGAGESTLLDIETVPGQWRLGSDLTEANDGRIHGTVNGFADGAFEASGLFALNRNGTGFVLHTILHNDDELNPRVVSPQLLAAGNGRIYATASGGPFIDGVLIAYDPDGSDLQNVHVFGSADTGGHEPVAGVVYARDNRLYGLARSGGRQFPFDNSVGTLYSLKPNGTGFRVHHLFGASHSGQGNTGESPQVALVRGSNGLLYGSTPTGGEHGSGTIFSVTPGSGKFKVLHHLTYDEGADIPAPLVEGPGGMLFGVAENGGQGLGTVFSLHRTGKNFKRLHAFSRTPMNIGEHPVALVLTERNDLLFSTRQGGSDPASVGTTWVMNRAGTTFSEGQGYIPGILAPPQTLTRPDGPWIVGTSSEGVLGTDPDEFQFDHFGGVDSLFIPKPFTVPASSQLFQASDGRLYGATGAPHGAHGEGAIYSLDLATRTYHVHHDFGGPTAGLSPRARFTEGPDGTLYGTGSGGEYGQGAVFAFIRDLKVIAGPDDATFARNSPAQLIVLASGPGPLHYHWYRNGKLLRRSTSNIFDLGKAQPGEAGTYHVLVKNRFGSVTSRTATIVVQ